MKTIPGRAKRRNWAPAKPSDRLDDVFGAVARHFALLSDPTRLKILHAICREELPVTLIVATTGATQSNVSRHLARLREAGVVSRRRAGTTIYYSVTDPEFVEVCRNVCVQVAGRIDARQPLRKDLLEFAARH